jgi:hypothetical protein
MRFISTRTHGVEDYLVVVLLLLAPNIFGFTDVPAAVAVARNVAIVVLLMSLLTRYELGLFKVIPMGFHLAMDVLAGLLLVASPWLFDFADNPANVWAPHVAVGLVVLLSALCTQTVPRFDADRVSARSGGGRIAAP